MRTSSAGLHSISLWEGLVLHTYHDIAGIPTIGYGHALLPDESYPEGITPDVAMLLLQRDVANAELAVNQGVKVPLSQDAFDALVSFTYNVGTGAFLGSTMLRLLNAGSTRIAAASLLEWDHTVIRGVKVVSEGLLERRRAEARLLVADLDPPHS